MIGFLARLIGISPTLIYAGLTVLALGGLFTGYKMWERQIEHRVQLEQAKAQLELVVKEQAETINRQRQIAEAQERAQELVAQNNAALQKRMNSIDQYLRSAQAQQGDRPSSAILRETIERLRQQ